MNHDPSPSKSRPPDHPRPRQDGEEMSGWADRSRAAIAVVHRNLPDGATLAERTAAVDAAYPFGERSYWPYKAWLKARKAYLKQFGYRSRGEGEPLPLFAGYERDPATGRPIIK